MDKDAEPCAMQRLTAATTGDAVGRRFVSLHARLDWPAL